MNDFLKYGRASDCHGCTACVDVCPHGALSIGTDKKGFTIPLIDVSLCKDCGACEKVCTHTDKAFKRKKEYHQHIFAFKCLERDMLMASASGGLCGICSDYVVHEASGAVFGAAYDDNFGVKHICADDAEGLDKLKRSKYAQSSTSGVYQAVRDKLASGTEVLFCGTPCQVASLYSYLGRDYDNLLTIDLVCDGVPSPKVLDGYLRYLEKMRGSKVTAVNMKDKSGSWGWNKVHISVDFSDGTKFCESHSESPYMNLFLSGTVIRDSCLECPYSNFDRFGDITAGDYWGVEKRHPDFFTSDGVSLMMVNTEKGRRLADAISNHAEFLEISAEEACQPRLKTPPDVRHHDDRETFFRNYSRHGFEKALGRYLKTEHKRTVPKRTLTEQINRIKRRIARVLRRK